MRTLVELALPKKGFTPFHSIPPGTWESEGDISLYTITII